MANNDVEQDGIETDMAAPLLQGQLPEYFADSTKGDDDHSYRDGLRHRRHVAGQKTNKINAEMTESDEEHGGMEANTKTPPLPGQHQQLLPDRSHDDGLRHRRSAAGQQKTAEIIVQSLDKRSYRLEVDLSADTIGDVMASVKEKWGFTFNQQRIIFNGKETTTDSILAHCGIKAGNTVHLVTRRGSGGGDRGQNNNKITGSNADSDATESDEEDGGMEADGMATPLLQLQSLHADRTHNGGRSNKDGLSRRCRTVPGRKMAEITVKSPVGRSYQLLVDLSSDTIIDVMASIKEEWGYLCRDQIIMVDNKHRHSEGILGHCGVKHGSTLYVAPRLRGGGTILDEASKERWCTKALLLSVALFSAYLNNSSTSTSPIIVVRDIFFVIFVLLFVVTDAVLSLAMELLPPNYGNPLVWISGLLVELVTCLLSISFNAYYALVFPALLALVVTPLAIKFHGDNSNDRDTEDDDYDRLFKLSEGIASCGSLITVVLGHYDTVAGPGKVAVGLFFFSTIALGLYMMMAITVRAVSCCHATWLARVLVLLLLITLIIASVEFIGSPLRTHAQVLETQQQHAWPPSPGVSAFSRSNLRA